MVRIDHIVCPLDFSEVSEAALRQATKLARWYGASVTALHVWPAIRMAAVATQSPVAPTHLEGPSRADLTRELERAAAGAGLPTARTRALVVEGDAVTEIVRLASDRGTDLVVMGTRGRAGLKRWLMGSVTEGVLRRAPCPVLTVTPRTQAYVSPVELRTIVCAVDFSEASLHALEYGFSLAQERRARLVLLHVVAGLGNPADEALFLSPDFARRVRGDALARLRSLVPEGAEDWSIPETRVGFGKAGTEILRLARERNADLVVMGARRKAGFDAPFSASTIRTVASQADCPVLAVPAPGRVVAARPISGFRSRQEERSAV